MSAIIRGLTAVSTGAEQRQKKSSYSEAASSSGVSSFRRTRGSRPLEGMNSAQSVRSGSATSAEDGQADWKLAGRRGRPSRKAKSARQRTNLDLRGAKRVDCHPFHLSGLSPDNDITDVLEYCRKRGIFVAGGRLIHTRVWGTKSAKIFIDCTSKEQVLAANFWPELVKCRAWLKQPPARANASAAPQ